MIEHIDSCSEKHIRNCPSNKSLHGELPFEHWWNGWPGAVCLKCGDDDLREDCMGESCKCPCHIEFWENYTKYIQEEMEESNELEI